MATSSHVQTLGWTTRDFAATFQRMILERYEEIGRRVRRLREEQGYSQEALAAAAGLSAKTISRVENPPSDGPHETRGSTYRKLAEVLDTSVAYLREPLNDCATITVNGQAPPDPNE